MTKIVWCGNKAWDNNFPEKPLGDNAKKVEKKNTFVSSFPYGILPLLICVGAVLLKWFVIDTREINPFFLPVGIVAGLLLMIVHELLHAICYTKENVVYVGISIKKFAAFAICHEKIRKGRFIIMSLLPMILGIIPLVLFLIIPSNGIVSGILIPLFIMGMLGPMPDYRDVYKVLRQVPNRSYVHSQNDGLYWYN